MRHIRNIAHLLVVVGTSVLLSSCSKDFKDDIDKLNSQHTSIEQRVSTLESKVMTMNTQLSQLSVLATAVEKDFYITQVKTTGDGYELTLNNGHVIVLQNGSDNTMTLMPAVSMTQISGFYFWTLNGVLLTDADGKPIPSSGRTPVVKYDYTLMQWVISIDGGVTFKNINEYASIVINDTVLLQIINNYLRQHSTTLISQQMLFQIISTYIQQNYAELFSVKILDEVVVNYVNQHYAKLFSYELLEKIFNQYNFEYYTSQIDVDVLINAIITYIKENKEIFLNNEVLYEIVSSYIKVNKNTIFTNEMLVEVINNFLENNENFIDVELLTLVVNNYIDQHQDVIFNTETFRKIVMEYVKKYYTQVFSQTILVQVLNTYVTQNSKTIFNRTLIEEVVNNYLKNNFTTVITNEVIHEIINNYLKVNSTTVFNRELLIEVITNYFEKNYNLFIDRTVISQAINTYIEKHSTTLISVDIIQQIVYRYLEQYYYEVFSYDMLSTLIYNYFETNRDVLYKYISEGSDVIRDVSIKDDMCIVTLSNGQTVNLVVYDAMARLRDRVQSIVVLPNESGRITDNGNGLLNLRYLVSPAAMAQVIAQKYNSREVTLELKTTDGNGNISTLSVYELLAKDGVLNMSAMSQNNGNVKAVALYVKENKIGGTDFMTEFTPVGKGQEQRGYLECPDDNHPHMINLGLPSGTLWSCCNVGAHSPSDYGTYHAWGETWTKSSYSYDSYAYKQDGSTYGMKNIGVDIAGTEYDVAYTNWGSKWCMPSAKQLKELIDNTTPTMMPKQGLKLTGSNGGYIFLPAAGSYYDTSLHGQYYLGCYWSSSISTERQIDSQMFATLLRFDVQHVEVEGLSDMAFRYNGLTVRPVAND